MAKTMLLFLFVLFLSVNATTNVSNTTSISTNISNTITPTPTATIIPANSTIKKPTTFRGSFVVILLVFFLALFGYIPPDQLQELDFSLTARYNQGAQVENFRLYDLVDQGTFGQTFKAEFVDNNGNVLYLAIRILSKSRDVVNHLKEEVKTQSRFQNNNFLAFFSYFDDEDCIYLCLEYPINRSVLLYLDVLNEEEVSIMILDIIEALRAAHRQGIKHRKVTVDKLFFGENSQVKIADFGWCIHEKRVEHEDFEDADDILAIAIALLARVEMSNLAVDFVSQQNVTLHQLANHLWLTTV